MSSLSEGTVLSQYSTAYEPDMDSLFNLEQFGYQASDSTKSKPSLNTRSSFSARESSVGDFGNTVSSNAQSQMSFSGPSHQYDDHQQQTGLPTGSLAHAMTFSTSTAMNFGPGFQGFNSNGDVIGNAFKQETPVNFATVPTRNPSRMSVESASPFYRPSNAGPNQQFIDPTALDGLDMSPISQPAQVGRMYPGMHQQQAAMARATQQPRQLDGHRGSQQHTSSQADGLSRQPSLSQDRNIRPTDPIVEERISRLLQQMREKAIASQQDLKQSSNVLPQIGRLKKDEDDMDEDERLLASEEGKKLSSKERRQLRNKVSARAFRSRRKEYIGQLEGEVAAKTNEANELRIQNRALIEENKSLTDLTRTLLSSPHFSSFMDELTQTGSSLQQQPPQPQQTMQRADSSRHNAQVGMVMVPEPTVDLSAMDITSSGWNSGIDMNFTHAPVFAVLEVPEGPTFDPIALSGKSSNSVDFASSENAKEEAPCLDLARPLACEDSPPTSSLSAPTPPVPVTVDREDESLALFLDDAPAVPSASQEMSDDLFCGLRPEKLFARYDLVVEGDSRDVDAATMHRFSRLCASIDASFERVSLFTAHLL